MTFNPPRLLTCVGVESDLDLLPHWLAYYRALGVAPERTHVILNARTPDAPALTTACEILEAAACAAPEIWVAPYTSAGMWERRRALQSRVAGPDDWVLSADVDEFHAYPEPLGPFLSRCDALKVDCVQGVFLDRLAPGGRLAPVTPAPHALEQFPIVAEVGWSIAGAGAAHDITGTFKIMAMKSYVVPGLGGHHVARGQPVSYLYGGPLRDVPGIERPRTRFAVPTRVHHLHWTESLPDRLRIRLATKGVSKGGAEYSAKQISHLDRHGGVALDAVALAPNRPAPGIPEALRLRRTVLRRDRLRRLKVRIKALLP